MKVSVADRPPEGNGFTGDSERHDDRAALVTGMRAPVLPRARTCPGCGHSLAVAPPTEAERRETRAGAVAAKIVAVLLTLYMLGVAGYFVYDHLL